jgi:transposase
MKKIDGRRLSVTAQEELRRVVVQMKRKGSTLKEIHVATGMCYSSISMIWKAYNVDGESSLKSKRRGRRTGDFRHLTQKQENRIRSKIIDRRPDQLKLDFALWTREAVRQLIKKEVDLDMPIRTVGEYLKRWGFTPQKPVKFAYERNPERVENWLKKEYPLIRERAKAENADIYWGDETSVRSGDVRGRGFSPRGVTPVVNATAKYENLSMISAITNKGKLQWMIVDGTVNIERFIEYLKSLIKYSRRKIFLIVDNLKVHHGKLVQKWVEKHKHRIELFFLPAYSPDLNPDEHLNSDLKYGVGSKAPGRSREHLRNAMENHLSMLKKVPDRICRYFKDPAISYAAI